VKCPECPHTLKHHKQSGRCRKGCDCDIAALKANYKRQRDMLADVRRKAEALAS
jgi:hypothetical protein